MADRRLERSPVLLSAYWHRNIIQLRFCYDENVWQQDAVRTGRFAVKHSRSFLKHVLPGVLKPLRVLWNQIIGFLFLALGTVFAIKAYRYFDHGNPGQFLFTIGGAALMAWFGLSSFWRARKISRS